MGLFRLDQQASYGVKRRETTSILPGYKILQRQAGIRRRWLFGDRSADVGCVVAVAVALMTVAQSSSPSPYRRPRRRLRERNQLQIILAYQEDGSCRCNSSGKRPQARTPAPRLCMSNNAKLTRLSHLGMGLRPIFLIDGVQERSLHW
jgi:hypothetical protein